MPSPIRKATRRLKDPRIYAGPGEAGTLMCTWPRGGGGEKAVPGVELREENPNYWSGPGIYFYKCMNGFEYQVAVHMIWEGLLDKGLATAKAVHDRYAAEKRNPFNEIECSDHYSRSLASYGLLLAVCGFDYHGPKGYIKFDPQLTPEDFKAFFTVANGWGTFEQERTGGQQFDRIHLKFGRPLCLGSRSMEREIERIRFSCKSMVKTFLLMSEVRGINLLALGRVTRSVQDIICRSVSVKRWLVRTANVSKRI